MIDILYFAIAFVATCAGAVTGIGGGIIIKPIMDLLGHFDASSIGVVSAMTVLAMAVSSLIKQIISKTKIDFVIADFLAVGALIGGNLGQRILDSVISGASSNTVVATQSILLAIAIIISFAYLHTKEKIKSLDVTSRMLTLLAGFGLGVVSSFLGIGGGPINIAVIMYVFGYSAKKAAVYSIIVILFSQISKLVQIAFTTGFEVYDLSVAPAMIIAGIIGGILGTKLNKKFTVKKVETSFDILQIFIFIIVVYNAINALGI